jgi:hypothetical protein
MDATFFDRLVRHLGVRTNRRTALGTSLAALALGGRDRLAAGQATPTAAPGASPTAESGVPEFMFVQTATSGRGEVNPSVSTPTTDSTPTPGGASFLLTLEDHPGLTVYFSDRPDRVVGATRTQEFLDGLGFGAENPPNAALVAEFERGQGVVVLELIEPVYDASTGTLVYGAEALAGYQGESLTPVVAEQIAARLPATFGPAALFIDACADLTTCWCAVPHDGTDLGPVPDSPVAMVWAFGYARCWPKSWGEYVNGISSCWAAYSAAAYSAGCPGQGYLGLGRSDYIFWP